MELRLEKSRGRVTVTLEARKLGSDLLVAIYGGAAHIGAAGAGTCMGGRAGSSVITMPGHRDDRIAKDAAERISKLTGHNCAVVAGVHYDHITQAEIEDVLSLTNSLIAELGENIRKGEL